MKILNLIIKQKYFDEIIAGTKTQEFREIRPSSQKKYVALDEEGDCIVNDGCVVARGYDAIRFFVGYNKDRASALVKIKNAKVELFVDEDDEFIELEEKGVPYIAAQVVYDLGEIIEKNV